MFSLSLFSRLFGSSRSAVLKRHEPIVSQIGSCESEMMLLSNESLRNKTLEFRARLQDGAVSINDILPDAFAAVRESARRTLTLRHFDVQMIGGVVLHGSGIAEMRTGEGKTLVATLPVYLNALSGKGVHVVTVNDYLARRDAVWMGQVYAALGMSVGVINTDGSYLYDETHEEALANGTDEKRDKEGGFKVHHEFLRPCSRRDAYEADITYGTNSEFGFDYLRDNIAHDPSEIRQRGHYFAVIDEIDSILIDEARTPLIISAPTTESEDLYTRFVNIAKEMQLDRDFTVDEKRRVIQLTDEGIEHAENSLGVENIYTEKGIKYVHHLETAVRAKALFSRDKEYVVRGGEVVIVDEFTGRMQPGRRWSEGLHQAIEAKEGVSIQKESRTYASITYQNYFRLYEHLAGMTGTASTSAEEFYKVYGLEVVEIPTNQNIQRIDHNDLIFQTEHGKFGALAREIKLRHEKGQPVLIGTVSIEKNELLSAYLKSEGIPHEMLNAKNHEREGEIIACAGVRGRVTLATNMAGRGVDIKLGGATASAEEAQEVKSLGGLFVVGTERHEARRIDNQLRGRSGRQGDPGETQFFVSLDDPLMRVFASETIKGMLGRFGIPEDEPIQNSIITRSLESAQKKIEGFHFDSRKHVLEYDNVLDKQRRAVYARRMRILQGTLYEVETVLKELATSEHSFAEESESYLALLERKESEFGRERFLSVARNTILRAFDFLWVDHLEMMEYLRGSVSLRAYGQRDPLVEYRREGVSMYKEMEAALTLRVFDTLSNMHAEVEVILEPNSIPAVLTMPGNLAQVSTAGRNDACPCGSGKKYKNCGLVNTQEHNTLVGVLSIR